MKDALSTYLALELCTDAPQQENFSRMADILPATSMTPSTQPRAWPSGELVDAPASYTFEGREKSFEQFFADTETTALLMIKEGEIRYERYAMTGGPEVPWIAWSMSKSFISALVGIAIEEGHIGGIEDPISNYIRVQPGSAYEGVSIKNVLNMASGARWNEQYNDAHEQYNDAEDDFWRLVTAQNCGSFEEFVASMVPEYEPGTLCRYNSGDSEALGLLLTKATGRSVRDYMQEKLCEPLGFTSPSYWLVDSVGVEGVYAFLNMTARDYARLGELYCNSGRHEGRQIVPEDWVRESTTIAAPYLEPGKPLCGITNYSVGYGYQWWLPDSEVGEFCAIGLYSQYIHVDPSRDTVIVKLSANRATGFVGEEDVPEHLEFMRALARQT